MLLHEQAVPDEWVAIELMDRFCSYVAWLVRKHCVQKFTWRLCCSGAELCRLFNRQETDEITAGHTVRLPLRVLRDDDAQPWASRVRLSAEAAMYGVEDGVMHNTFGALFVGLTCAWNVRPVLAVCCCVTPLPVPASAPSSSCVVFGDFEQAPTA